jgi:hypothetical protein
MRRIVSRLATAGETILAPASFLLYRLTRLGVRRALQVRGRAETGQATAWRILDGAVVREPFHLLALMTTAPRWNTHALIALAGPLQVERGLRIHAATAARSAPAWTVVVHAEPDLRIVASTGSVSTSDTSSGAPWQAVELAPGRYRLVLRYYRWSGPAELPAIEVDGVPTVDSQEVPAGANDFYHDLAKRRSLLYTGMHSYIRTLLRYRRWLPRSFVEREYLPAGNPQTTFSYGLLEAGTRLTIRMHNGLRDTHDAYFTGYNRASLPVLWYPLTEREHVIAHVPVNGSYLIRVHPRTPAPPPEGREPAQITCQQERIR